MVSAATTQSTTGPVSAHGARPLTVLVIEDDDDLRAEMVELMTLDGHRVLEASNGAMGLEVLRRSEAVDLVLLDLWMPTMDGWNFRVHQRKDPVVRDVPVIVLTADDGAQARAIDADAVVRKPFDAVALSATVRRVVAERRAQVGETASLMSKTLTLLAGAVSHEVASPLMVLISWLERVRRPDVGQRLPAVGDAGIDDMLAQCWRIADTLRTLRALPYPAWVNEAKVDVAQLMQTAITEAQLEPLHVRFTGQPGLFVHGEPLVVLYACTAVLHHAIEGFPGTRAAPTNNDSSEPDVDVRVERQDGNVVVQIDDRGPAIPDEDVDRVFSVDYTGRARAWSAGLRLWYVRHAIEGLGGTIEIKNRIPHGVRCRLELPT